MKKSILVRVVSTCRSRLKFALALGVMASGGAHAATTFTFTIPTPPAPYTTYQTSAGVYVSDPGHPDDGALVRTLWRNETYAPGAFSTTWDDKDDFGALRTTGNYQIRVIYHNVQYTWDGVIGNTSSTFSGLGTHFNFEPISAMAFSGTNGYYCAGYNEAHYDFTRFATNAPKIATDHFSDLLWTNGYTKVTPYAGDISDRGWACATADSTNVWFACANSVNANTNLYPIPTGNNANPGFVQRYYTTNDYPHGMTNDMLNLYPPPYGTNVASGEPDALTWGDAHQYRPYGGALVVGTQPGLSGMAVQPFGSVLAVCVGADNKVYLYDKASGAPYGTANSFTVTNPQGLAFAPNGDLWVLSGTSALRYTSIGTSNTLATTVPGFQQPLAIAVDPRTTSDVVLVADGGTNQHVVGFTSAGATAAGWSAPLGRTGGIAANPQVTTNNFYFIGRSGAQSFSGPGTWLSFQPDGSFWLGDLGNNRALHYNADTTYKEQIGFRAVQYVESPDLNNPTNLYAEWFQYAVTYPTNNPSPGTPSLTPGDPSAPGGNRCWQFTTNWAAAAAALNPPGTELYTGEGYSGFSTVVTLNNNRTWALLNRTDLLREIVELKSNGTLAPTGITFNSSSTLYANGEIRTQTNSGNVASLTRRTVHFDSTGYPTWDPPTNFATCPAGIAAPASVTNPPFWSSVPFLTNYGTTFGNYYPVHQSNYDGASGPRIPSTANGTIITLDTGNTTHGNFGMHLGGIREGATSYTWGASPAITTGGYFTSGLGPDGMGSYSLDADTLGGWAGTEAWTIDQDVMYNYNGQYSNFMNQFMHYWEDGLFIGQFGTGGAGSNFPKLGPIAGLASNASSPSMVRVGNSLYIYQTDEMHHSGTHRWRMDGQDSLVELFGTGAMNTTIPVTSFTKTLFKTDFEGTTNNGTCVVTTSTGASTSPSSRPPNRSLHVGKLPGLNSTGISLLFGGLTTGQIVNISCDANNDNATGDPRGAGITMLIDKTDGTLSRRIDMATGTRQTWQTLAPSFTLVAGEASFYLTFNSGYSQPNVYLDNVKVTVTTP